MKLITIIWTFYKRLIIPALANIPFGWRIQCRCKHTGISQTTGLSYMYGLGPNELLNLHSAKILSTNHERAEKLCIYLMA